MSALKSVAVRELLDPSRVRQAINAQPGGLDDVFDVDVHLIAWGPISFTLVTGISSLLVMGFAPRTLGFSALGMIGIGLFACGLVRTVRTWRTDSLAATRCELMSPKLTNEPKPPMHSRSQSVISE